MWPPGRRVADSVGDAGQSGPAGAALLKSGTGGDIAHGPAVPADLCFRRCGDTGEPAMRDEKIRLGAFLTATGQHVAAWRDPAVPADMGTNIATYVEAVRLAECGRFDMMFLADNAGAWQRDIDTGGRDRDRGHRSGADVAAAARGGDRHVACGAG
jgi:hypothetical protein